MYKYLKTTVFLFATISVLLLSGCSSHLTAEQSAPVIKLNNLNEVSFAVLDKREYVVSGDKNASFEGIIRSGLGIPYSHNTFTNQPMSAFLSDRLVVGFANHNIKANKVDTVVQESENDIIEKLKISGNKSIIFTLNEWKYDFHAFSDNSWFNVDLTILNENGNTVLVKNFNGENDIPDSDTIPNQMQMIYKSRFENIFSDEMVKKALLGN